jgi:hypothetical protein
MPACDVAVILDHGVYTVESRGRCEKFEIDRAKNTASISNFAVNLGGMIDTWEEEHVKGYSMKVVHQVKLPGKVPVDAFLGKDHVQLISRDQDGVTWSAMITREPQVTGKTTFNQVAVIGKGIDASIHSPEGDTMKARVNAITDMIQYVEIHELNHPDFNRGERTPATDQFVYFNDEERRKQ